jgi:large subunit ribosomal protein L5
MENKMREIEIEKIVFNCGGLDEKLARSVKLIEKITSKKAVKVRSRKRIPAFGISPNKESGCKTTIRNPEEIKTLLKRCFVAVDNKILEKSIVENQTSIGIPEYIEVPGLEYDREIGILGFQVTIVFKRNGKRVAIKKIKKGKYPKRQDVTKQEIIDYLIKNFNLEVIKK